jgi:hypothetical protein
MIHVIAFAAAFSACLAYCLIAGGRPERWAICAQLIAFLLSLFAISFRWNSFVGLPIGLSLIDITLAAALAAIALRANRLWPIVLAGMQVATVFAHVAKLLTFPLPTAGYAIFVQFWAWPMLVVTALGTRNHHLRKRRYGQERDWKPLWPPSVQARSTV